MQFKDRIDAGKKLARLLGQFKNDSVVYALPRGGVVVAAQIARALGAHLDLVITRKIGHPYQNELAIAALTEDGHIIIDPYYKHLSKTDWFLQAVEEEEAEAKRRREKYLAGIKPIPCFGKTAILVDDGVATGLTLKSAIKQLKVSGKPKEIIAAIPVIPEEIARQLEKEEGVKIIALERTDQFLGSIGAYYRDFSQVPDEEVIDIMKKLRKRDL